MLETLTLLSLDGLALASLAAAAAAAARDASNSSISFSRAVSQSAASLAIDFNSWAGRPSVILYIVS